MNSLTGLRFFAASAVFLVHFGAGRAAAMAPGSAIATLLQNGFLGVSLFFVLSGFVLARVYDARPASEHWLQDFLTARISRIYPVYLLALCLMLPFADGMTPYNAVRVLTATQSWTLPASNLGGAWMRPAWTISVEAAFYLAFPLLLWAAKLMDEGERWIALVSLWAGMILMATPLAEPGSVLHWPLGAIPLPMLRGLEFFTGVLLALQRAPKSICNGWVTAAAAGAIVALMASTTMPQALSAVPVLGGVLMWQMSASRSVATRLLGSAPMQLMGTASFALYLLQFPVRAILRLLPGDTFWQAANPVIAMAAALAVFTWYETPARIMVRGMASAMWGRATISNSALTRPAR